MLCTIGAGGKVDDVEFALAIQEFLKFLGWRLHSLGLQGKLQSQLIPVIVLAKVAEMIR